MSRSIALAQRLLGVAERIVFFTGAGLGAESGIPTFRGSGGLWQGVRPETLATPQAFEEDPVRVWEWYQWRRRLIRDAPLHDGHRAIADVCRKKGAVVITQNVDGMHQRSGCESVAELHGSIWRSRCQVCEAEAPDESLDQAGVPLCPCGGPLRPAVVWFGESLPPAPWNEAQVELGSAAVVVVVGTSAVVQPAASLTELARRAGARVVEVNPEPVGDARDVIVDGGAAECLPLILAPCLT